MIEDYFGWNYVYVEHDNQKNIDEWIDRCDLYMGAGGADVFPALYGSPIKKDENMDCFDRQRDLREIYIIKKFIKAGKPITGICRNLQLYCSLFLKLELVDLLGYKSANVCHHPSKFKVKLKDDEDQFCHQIELNTGKKMWVNSHHTMGILVPKDKSGELLDGVEIRATGDLGEEGVPKIIEWVKDSSTNVNMVQFHPELMYKTNEASQMFLEEIKKMVE